GQGNLSFRYDKVGLTTKTQNQDGSYASAGNFTFNVATNSEGASLPTPTPGNAPVTAHVSKYFLLIDGFNGDSIDPNHGGWFDLAEFNQFDFAISSATGGRAAFGPLTVNPAMQRALSGTLSDVARDTHISAVRVEGVTQDG